MPFQFICPYCFKRTLVNEELSGQSGPCVGCGKLVTIPDAPRKPSAARPIESTQIEKSELRKERRKLASLLRFFGLMFGLVITAGLTLYVFYPSLKSLKARRDAMACMANLQRVAEALRAYAVDHGTFPTPTVTDATGKPLYSWRVLILPYIGESALYSQFKLDEAWDSPNNSALIGVCPLLYLSPTVNTKGVGETNYVLLTGRGTIFPPTGPLRLADITDGLNQTLLVVETDNGANEWTKPYDIDVSTMNGAIGTKSPNTIGGSHSGGATAALADGSPAWLPSDLPFSVLDAAITPQGNESVKISSDMLKFR